MKVRSGFLIASKWGEKTIHFHHVFEQTLQPLIYVVEIQSMSQAE